MGIWSFSLYLVAVILVVGGILILSHFLGQRHQERATAFPFEGGILPSGSARIRLSAQFYFIAVLFVIFDVESIFIFTWVIAGRKLGWAGYWEIAVFIGVLFAALVYLLRLGALDWGPKTRESFKRIEIYRSKGP
jgi:NADH-quinone oxidoreductase subunit A